jgi:sugar lactone lactonase YvrE
MLEAQPSFRIETVAGTFPADEGVAATAAVLDSPRAAAISIDGSVYYSLASVRSHIRRIGADGQIALTPGGFATDLQVGRDNALYYVNGGPEFYKVDANGNSVTLRPVAGPIQPDSLVSVCLDPDGNALVADQRANRILRIAPDLRVSVVAGLGSFVRLDASPLSLAMDSVGNLFFAQSNLQLARLQGSEVVAVAGNRQFGAPAVGGPATASPFRSIRSIAVNEAGELFIADAVSRMILKVNGDGALNLVLEDVDVSDIATGPGGVLVYVDPVANRIWGIDQDGTRILVAGRDQFEGDGGPAEAALLKAPSAAVLTGAGELFIADTGNHRIRKVSADGIISTVAGNGEPGEPSDSTPAEEARITYPGYFAVDPAGSLYFAGLSGQTIWRLQAGALWRFAGNGQAADSGDGGPAAEASFRAIAGLAADSTGNVYVSDATSNRIRKIDVSGRITTVSGNGTPSIGTDGERAAETGVFSPRQLALDADGGLVFFESGSRRIRRVSPDGILSTVSSTAPLGIPSDAAASQLCVFAEAAALNFDIQGNLLVSGNSVICRLSRDGATTLLAGGRTPGFSGDGGLGVDAELSVVMSLAVDTLGNVYLADRNNHRIRKLSPVQEYSDQP